MCKQWISMFMMIIVNKMIFIKGPKVYTSKGHGRNCVMRYYMTANALPLQSFNILDRIHCTTQKQSFKGKKKEPSIYYF